MRPLQRRLRNRLFNLAEGNVLAGHFCARWVTSRPKAPATVPVTHETLQASAGAKLTNTWAVRVYTGGAARSGDWVCLYLDFVFLMSLQTSRSLFG